MPSESKTEGKVKLASRVEHVVQVPGAIRSKIQLEDPSILLELDKDESKVHAIVLGMRPGANKFCTWLEHEHFNPLTDREPLMEYRYVYWADEAFILITIPFGDWQLIHQAAEVAGLKVANGVPTAIDGNGIHFFPMQSQRICSLENHPLPFYFGSDEHQLALMLENVECDKIRMKTHEQFKVQCRDSN